eukprot:TRINITY_DN47619_c0_g1_i1.p1 TRINITY_DN47619_c0_g1~~TRINITY_DN47619_c0_g1_i1.p1  ORF type:complete len:701 (-),score=120.94 TRINITY_DN47619_c0_g1_i1:90-2192(-)
MVAVSLRCGGLGAALLVAQAVAQSSSVVIGTAADITKCLGVRNDYTLVLEDCLDAKGTSWRTPAKNRYGHLRLSAETFNHACVNADLMLGKCAEQWSLKGGFGPLSIWSWKEDTLQLQVDLGNETKCLAKSGGDDVKLEDCKTLSSFDLDQNGEGAPAEQTWVLLPAVRPQIDILKKIKFPLRTSGRYFIDSEGNTVKLVGVNWIGAHMEMLVNNGLSIVPVLQIAKMIKHMGFNTVRMNYASWMHKTNESGHLPRPPVVKPSLLAANPELEGLSALEVFDACVEALTSEGLLVILNRHMGKPGWCCSGTDGSQMWFGDGYTTEDWLDSLTFMADRYKKNERVVGFDILNEPRPNEASGDIPWWGLELDLPKVGLRVRDWRMAAARGAVAVWKGNPDQLVIVEGAIYAANLQGVTTMPMNLAQQCLLHSKVAYSSHHYHWYWQLYRAFSHFFDEFNPFYLLRDLKDIKTVSDATQTEQLAGEQPFQTGGAELISYPRFYETRNASAWFVSETGAGALWVSEFGTPSKKDNTWWKYLMRAFKDSNMNWCYWPLDPIKRPKGWEGKEEAHRDDFGIFDPSRRDYKAVVGWKLQDLIAIQAPSPEQPAQLMKPAECEFLLEENEDFASRPTSLLTFVHHTVTDVAIVQVAVLMAVLVMSIITCCYICIGLSRRKAAAAVSPEETLPLVSATPRATPPATPRGS